MTRREKILGAIVVVLLAGLAGRGLLTRYWAAVERNEAKLYDVEMRHLDVRTALSRGKEAKRKLEQWQNQSLPPSRAIATSAYRTWLIDKLQEANLKTDDIKPVQPESRSARGYDAVAFHVYAVGTLDQLIDFLHEFYCSDQLHKITNLTIAPIDSSANLQLDLKIEALLLPGSNNIDQLSDATSNRLALETADAYRESIVGRNIFRVYSPPKPAVPERTIVKNDEPPPPKFDDAAHAYVTGITQNGSRLMVWITVRTTGERLFLYQDDPIKVGLLDGHIRQISDNPAEIVLEVDGQRQLVKLGQNLREGRPLPPSDS